MIKEINIRAVYDALVIESYPNTKEYVRGFKEALGWVLEISKEVAK